MVLRLLGLEVHQAEIEGCSVGGLNVVPVLVASGWRGLEVSSGVVYSQIIVEVGISVLASQSRLPWVVTCIDLSPSVVDAVPSVVNVIPSIVNVVPSVVDFVEFVIDCSPSVVDRIEFIVDSSPSILSCRLILIVL